MNEAKNEGKSANGGKVAAPPETAELVKPGKMDEDVKGLEKALSALGLDLSKLGPVEHVQQGGVTKWLDMKKYMVDPNTSDNSPAAANGKFFAGLLLGRQEIEDDKGEPNADGVKVRHFYSIKLATEAFTTYKNEDDKSMEHVSKPLDIIAVGERHSLRAMREWVDDGGTYLVIVKPHSRIRIGGNQTMWTFDVKRVVISPPMKQRVEVVNKGGSNRVPF